MSGLAERASTGQIDGWWGGRTGRLIIIVLILWAATAVRFYQLDGQSFWNDEGNSARLSERSVGLIVKGTASDVHPPLYYLALRGWRELLGSTEFALRAFSAFAGVLTVVVTYRLGAWWGRSDVAWWAAIGVAFSPPLLYYSQEARMYSLLALLTTAVTLLLFLWAKQPDSWPLRLGYILLATAGLYTHYLFPAILVAHNVVMLVWLGQMWRRPAVPYRFLGNWLGLMLATALFYAPWLPIFLRGTGGREAVFRPLLDYLGEATPWLLIGLVDPTAVPRLFDSLQAILLFALAAFVPLDWWGGVRRPAVWPLVAWLGVVWGLIWVVGATTPGYHKFLVAILPALWLLVAVGVVKLWALPETVTIGRWGVWGNHIVRRVFQTGILATLSFFAPTIVYAMEFIYHDPAYARADYRGMAAQISEENHPAAGIILNAPNQWEVFTYYYQGDAPVYPLAQTRLDEATAAAELAPLLAQHRRLYALFWGEAERDPERVVERWLDQHAFKAVDEWRGDVRFVVYAVPTAAATQPTAVLRLPVGEGITLVGYALAESRLQPTDIIEVTLFWDTAVPQTKRYKIFLHLLNAQGELVAQRDAEPVGNLKPTTIWAVGEPVVDKHGVLLPAGLPGGEYSLQVGLYALAEPHDRLPIRTAVGVVDSYPLATIQVGLSP